MTFAWPVALVGLVAVPVLAGLYLLSARKRRRDAARFANPALVPNLVPAKPGWRRYVAPILALASLALLIVGVARPHVVRSVARDDATIVLAIDTSRSMAAQDVQPSRFDAAKQAALAFLDEVPDNYSVGIVSFATSADPVLPPTTDREAARSALRELRLGTEPRSARRSPARSTSRSTGRAAASDRRPASRHPPPCCSSPTGPRRRATSDRDRRRSGRGGSACPSPPSPWEPATPWSRCPGRAA